MAKTTRCLILEHDPTAIEQYNEFIPENIDICFIDNELSAFNKISSISPTFIIFNTLCTQKPISFINKIKKITPSASLIVCSSNYSIREAVFFIKNGAHDYFPLPLDKSDFQYSLSQILRTASDQDIDLKQSNKLVFLGELAAEIAHDIKTPLACISGFIDLFLGFLKKPQVTVEELQGVGHYLDKSIAETKRCQKILNNLLMFSKKEDFTHFCLADLIDRVQALIAQDLIEKNIQLKMNIDPHLQVYGSEEKLHQVLLNLLINAKNATKQGFIEVTAVNENEKTKISVRDSGCGIKNEDLDKIFNPFFTKTQQGTGLGLSIVKKIIEEHQGNISVQSQLEMGTTFIIELPIR
ncbi:sensor histidine kinase [Candidatus Uabimicrobium amorphum]|uniref:histidine kinase n=1 Tax=Uabimicrobium amorphum TaxID=2596890 RepID=A0A5S9F658_UABAM|nr:HAMP domain-containing sensor histidine kinase [Candidatus Uabimicrobium amorphum]BBM87031.1 sensor protein ZraS [Candidatus Uabimicrobium amorphum]